MSKSARRLTTIGIFVGLSLFSERGVRATSYSTSEIFPLMSPGAGSNAYVQFSAGGAVVGYSVTQTTNVQQAILWTGPSGSVANLNPTGLPGIDQSKAVGTDGSQQIGYGFGSQTSSEALLWNGSAASVVNLNPSTIPGVTNSQAYFTNGVQQVGFGYNSATPSIHHALLWNGSAASAVDLSPTLLGFTTSIADGADGGLQVGYGVPASNPSSQHALLWSGTGASAVDLNPSNLVGNGGGSGSQAAGVSGTQIVGYGYGPNFGSSTHALLWNGTAASAVDLQPTNFLFSGSTAIATNGTVQVGWGTGGADTALLWFGTAGSAVNLQNLLPATGSWTSSMAEGVDPAGDVFGTAVGTYQGVSGTFGIEWAPVSVPEPAQFVTLAVIMGLIGGWRRERIFEPRR